MRDYSPLYLAADRTATRELARHAVSEYRRLNADAFAKVEALQVLEGLMEQHGSRWVADRCDEICTARRVRGER